MAKLLAVVLCGALLLNTCTDAIFLQKKIYLLNKLKHKLGETKQILET